jgi:hypothetical protein
MSDPKQWMRYELIIHIEKVMVESQKFIHHLPLGQNN